jgi:hypothetical protein
MSRRTVSFPAVTSSTGGPEPQILLVMRPSTSRSGPRANREGIVDGLDQPCCELGLCGGLRVLRGPSRSLPGLGQLVRLGIGGRQNLKEVEVLWLSLDCREGRDGVGALSLCEERPSVSHSNIEIIRRQQQPATEQILGSSRVDRGVVAIEDRIAASQLDGARELRKRLIATAATQLEVGARLGECEVVGPL